MSPRSQGYVRGTISEYDIGPSEKVYSVDGNDDLGPSIDAGRFEGEINGEV